MERNDKSKDKTWKYEIGEKVSKKDTTNIDKLANIMKKNDINTEDKQNK